MCSGRLLRGSHLELPAAVILVRLIIQVFVVEKCVKSYARKKGEVQQAKYEGALLWLQ